MVEVQGLESADQVRLQTTDLTGMDISLLLPLWAGLSASERVEAMVNETITHPQRFWKPYGLPVCPQPAAESGNPTCHSIRIPWNMLIGEGLAACGYLDEAAELFTRLMNALVVNFKAEGFFRRSYDAFSGTGSGERDSFEGLVPVGLFMTVIGIKLFSNQQIGVAGANPFPWPVTIRYKGMTILRQKTRTQIIFPDGQTISLDDPAPQIVTLKYPSD
jgi:hypothetical protein